MRWPTCCVAYGLFVRSLLSAVPGLVYIGTYTDALNLKTSTGVVSRGIYALRFDSDNGTLSAPMLAAEAENPSFIAFDPGKRHLYAVDEGGGSVSSFAIDRSSGQLTFLNRQFTQGELTPHLAADAKLTPHLAVDASDRMLITVNYGYGSAFTCAFPIAADGRLLPRSSLIEPHGPLGPNRERQTQAHPHSVALSPDNRFVLVCDLGLDRISIYRLDPAHAGLVANEPAFAQEPPGVGPRHCAFSRDGRFLYSVNEMGGSVCVFAYDPVRGALALRQTLSTLPANFHGVNGSAEIQTHPNGRLVYASNRGEENDSSLAVLARDAESGALTLVQVMTTDVHYPRSFSISPDGRWLLCGNQETDQLALFRVDPASGRLAPTGRHVSIGQPVCVLFYD